MKERPILFTPENAHKVHFGTKTQTRRTIKPQPGQWTTGPAVGCSSVWPAVQKNNKTEHQKCPFGLPGDFLWVREAFKRDPHNDCIVHYRDGVVSDCRRGTHQEEEYDWVKWKNAMFMPRWASRTLLEVTEIRVERLQLISEEDAEAEGIDDAYLVKHHLAPPRRLAYFYLWDDINGIDSHKKDPLVWVISFKKHAT